MKRHRRVVKQRAHVVKVGHVAVRDHLWTVRVPRDLQELKLRIDAISQTLTGELGRSPTPAELAERANATTEQILEALVAATAHHPDSLDQPLSDEGVSIAIERCRMMAVETCRSASVSRRRRRVAVGARRVGP